jgi:hypothetical protein
MTPSTRPVKPVMVRVRCMGRMHRIAYAAGAQDVLLLDHPAEELPRLLGLNAVGGGCRCAQVYQAFRVRNAWHVPPRLRRLMPLPPPKLRGLTSQAPLPDEATQSLAAAVMAAAARCNYPRATARWGGGHHYVDLTVVAGDRPCAALGRREDNRLKDPRLMGGNSALQLHVHADWLTRVHGAGLALIPLQGRPQKHLLVLDVLRDSPLTVLAVRPGGGFQARAWPALVEGSPRVARWAHLGLGHGLLNEYKRETV